MTSSQMFRPTLFVAALAVLVSTAAAQDADVNHLLQSMASDDAAARYDAIDRLGELHTSAETVVPELRKLLADDDAGTRWRGARSLGDYGQLAKPSSAELRRLLGDDEPAVRYHAAVTLGKIGDNSDEAVSELVRLATGDDPRVARVAIASLRRVKADPKQVAKALSAALASDDHAVVVHALDAIVSQGAKAVPFLKEALQQPNTDYLACTAIEHIGAEAAGTIPELTKLLDDEQHPQLLIQAQLALGSIGPAAKATAPRLISLLENSDNPMIAAAAAHALGSIGAVDADEPLRNALVKPEPILQMVAAWSLAKLHPDDNQLKQQAITKLQAGLNSDDPVMKTAAAEGISQLMPKKAMPAKEQP